MMKSLRFKFFTLMENVRNVFANFEPFYDVVKLTDCEDMG